MTAEVHRSLWTEAIAGRAAIDLDEVDELASVGRFDHKFLVPVGHLDTLIGSLHDEWRVVESELGRSIRYVTTYLDTTDLLTFRMHRQGRRRRFKVRTRTYGAGSESVLEVKLRDARGRTTKVRLAEPHGTTNGGLEPASLTSVESVLAAAKIDAPLEPLVPSLTTEYTRTTLANVDLQERLTIDVGLEVARAGGGGAGPVRLGTSYAIVESKSSQVGSATRRHLRAAGAFPHRVSKYCVGLATTRPDVVAPQWRPALRRLLPPPTVVLRPR